MIQLPPLTSLRRPGFQDLEKKEPEQESEPVRSPAWRPSRVQRIPGNSDPAGGVHGQKGPRMPPYTPRPACGLRGHQPGL